MKEMGYIGSVLRGYVGVRRGYVDLAVFLAYHRA